MSETVIKEQAATETLREEAIFSRSRSSLKKGIDQFSSRHSDVYFRLFRRWKVGFTQAYFGPSES
jgi:hypothetical protein